MATQIKKKYIENDGIDGLKLLLLAGQTIRRLNEEGTEQDVIAYLEGLVSDENSRAVLAESGLDTRITELEAQVGSDLQSAITQLEQDIQAEATLRASEITRVEGLISDMDAAYKAADQNLADQISSLQGAGNVVFEDNAAVYADGTAPIEEPSGQDGWYYKNDGQNIGSGGADKVNWYFFDGSVQTETIDTALTGYAVGEIKGTEPFHLAIYTFPQGDGNDGGSWYRSRMVYVPANGSYEQNKKYLFVTSLEGTPANLYPDLERVEMIPSQISTVGPQDPSEQILTASLGTNSAAQQNSVEILVNNVGYASSVKGVVDTRFEIRGDFTLAGIKESLSEEEFKRQSEDERVLGESKSYTDTKVSELVDSAPEVLNTLKELSDALGSDENFATTVANNIGQVDAKIDSEAARLEGLVNAEESERIAADSTLQGNINAEQTARIAADSALSARVDILEAKPELQFSTIKYTALEGDTFIELDVEADKILSAFVGRLGIHEGQDFSVSVVEGKTRMTFINSLAAGGNEQVEAGDVFHVTYVS
jgi:hypothetical protein